MFQYVNRLNWSRYETNKQLLLINYIKKIIFYLDFYKKYGITSLELGGSLFLQIFSRSCPMKKAAIFLFAASVLLINFGSNVFAEDLSSQISALQQKADRVQEQINQAKQQANGTVDQQVKSLMNQADNLIKQRVQLDSQISKIDSQIDEIKNSTKSNLSRQLKGYDQELVILKQQISSLNAKKWAQEAAKMKEEDAKNQLKNNPAPVTPQTVPGPAAQK